MQKYSLNFVMVLSAVVLLLMAQQGYIGNYIQAVIMYVGINIIMSTSLNLVNGNMGEFTCGHAAFMCMGAYVSSILSVLFFGKTLGDPMLPASMAIMVFPVIVLLGGVVAALTSVLVAVPAFKTRDDYLAIITIAVNYMVISAIENMDFVGGSRGFQGMKDTVWAMQGTLKAPWMLFWVITFTVFTIWVIRRFITSTYGKGVNAVCQDETAAEIMSVNTNKIKLVNFMISAGLAGCAGGLFAHIVGYVNPQSFNILKSTEAMVMVYLGGMGSLSGAVLSAIVFTGLLEVLRSQALMDFLLAPATFIFPDWEPSAGVIKWVMIPLLLVLIMQFRPEGIMGNKELSDVFPKLKKYYTFK
ncbi:MULTISPECIES: branched-chain amino acid ABC transporter permease [unclassified Pseudodesulfovibrio]|uniref:branched-chain amino acid ABC transporter permease n=1 Tax=unclassified Pseudodesulfovibrio TaxID=2661612 RepID=UPI000FEBD6B1|nr:MULTISPECIES: branched-chain amino acid ABC transporter permease [unclassified Pseudodesulfovibrio]MCJ2164331.1 branched-chain amino acid ABC transporter permease [Pseudodesulfovibrio sp. S3-i]RWU04541.1 branched-chain amino acid ABC transporter permease [Pseudodesulfovibrio sp. S3]